MARCLNIRHTDIRSITLPLLGYTTIEYSQRLPLGQSAEYDKRVANISLFVYMGSPGLHQNSRQVPGSSCHLALASHRLGGLAYIYIIYIGYQYIISFFLSNVHLYSLTYFGAECLISHLVASALTQLIF